MLPPGNWGGGGGVLLGMGRWAVLPTGEGGGWVGFE